MNRKTIVTVSLGWLTAALVPSLSSSGQEPHLFKKEVTRTVEFSYLLYLPDGYENSVKKWPLILFLHGMGERGNDLEEVKKHGPPRILAEGKQLPFVVVSPQCPPDRWWITEDLNVLLDDLLVEYKIDPSRIYLTGLSMGGFAAWKWASEHPDRFAAIVPICGGGEPATAWRLRNLPIWAFHGAKDETVPLRRSLEMVEAVKKHGGNARLTVYPEAGHDSWTETYNNPELYEWFLTHTRD